MIQTFVILVITVLIRIVFGFLEPTYEVLSEWIPYVNWFIVGLVIVFALFVLIKIIREISKRR
ncbi:MAG: hypothetical protein J6B04_05600 [Clostridia bacterium]|nr:hypothetical protein [Clostridia bacterium]